MHDVEHIGGVVCVVLSNNWFGIQAMAISTCSAPIAIHLSNICFSRLSQIMNDKRCWEHLRILLRKYILKSIENQHTNDSCTICMWLCNINFNISKAMKLRVVYRNTQL